MAYPNGYSWEIQETLKIYSEKERKREKRGRRRKRKGNKQNHNSYENFDNNSYGREGRLAGDKISEQAKRVVIDKVYLR